MRNYLYLLSMSVCLMLITAVPVLANDFDQRVYSFELMVPHAPPNIDPPLIIFQADQNINYFYDADPLPGHPLPIESLIPRPGWQNNSAANAYIIKKREILAQNIRK